MATAVKLVENTVKELLAMGEIDRVKNLLIASGHGYHTTIGALTTPIVGGGAGTTIAIQQPEGIFSIGPNQALIPVRIKIECEVGLVASDSQVTEILLAWDRTNPALATNITGLVHEDTFNMRTDLGNAQAGELDAISAVSANITSPTFA